MPDPQFASSVEREGVAEDKVVIARFGEFAGHGSQASTRDRFRSGRGLHHLAKVLHLVSNGGYGREGHGARCNTGNGSESVRDDVERDDDTR